MIRISEPTARRHGVWMVVAFALLILLPGTNTLPLIDRDEPRFSGATIEMLERGDFIVPYFNDVYRFDKPPLTYWWMAFHYKLFGIGEFAARLHGVIASVCCGLAIYGFGRQIASARTGLFAALGFLTCLQVLIHGRLALADMPLIACGILTHWAIWNLVAPGSATPRRFGRWYWILWGSAGVGFLAKGPLAIFVPALSLILYRLAFYRRPIPWNALQVPSGLLVFLAPIAAWGIPALIATGGAYWDEGIGTHVVDRGLGAFNERVFLPGFYFLTAAFSLFPWFGLLWVWQRRVRRDWDPLNAFLLSWFLAPFLIFTFYATQLPHYTLPGFAAFFLLLFRRPRLPSTKRVVTYWQRGYTRLVTIALVGILGVIWITRLDRYEPGMAWGLTLVAVALLGLLRLTRRPFSLPAFAGLAVLIGLSIAVLGAGMRSSHATIQLAKTLGTKPGERQEGKLLGYHYAEPTLIYYTGHFRVAANRPEAALAVFAEEDPGLVILLRRDYSIEKLLAAWWSGNPPRPDREIEPFLTVPPGESFRISGFNPARFTWVDLEVWKRSPGSLSVEPSTNSQ